MVGRNVGLVGLIVVVGRNVEPVEEREHADGQFCECLRFPLVEVSEKHAVDYFVSW